MKVALSLLALFLVSTTSNATVDNVLLQKYAKPAQFLNIKISPDGKYFAATRRADDGNIQLVVLERDGFKLVSQQHFAGKDSIDEFFWVNNSRLVLSVAREVGALERPVPTGELYAMNADGKRRLMLTGYRSAAKEPEMVSIIDWLPEEDKMILIASYNWMLESPYAEVYRLNVDTGRKRRVERAPLRWQEGQPVYFIADKKGAVRFATGLDMIKNRDLVSMYKPTADAPWQELHRNHLDNGVLVPLQFTDDETAIIAMSNINSDTRALVKYDLVTKQETILLQHPKVDISPVMGLNKGNADEVIGGAFEYETIDAAFLADVKDPSFRNNMQMLMDAFPGQAISIRSATANNELLVIGVNSANTATSFYLYDTKKKQASFLLDSRPWLKDVSIPKSEAVLYKARDGLDIQAILTKPNNIEDNKKYPLILLPHGGPHGPYDSLSSMDTDAKVFAEHGYVVLQPNFRGSGGFGRSFEALGYRNWGTTMINDMTDGVQHLIKQGLVDPDRVCVYGGSYGGYATLMSAVREPELYKCAVGFVGVYDLNLMFEHGDIPKRQSGLEYLTKVLGTDKAQLDAQSPLYNLDKLKAPVFIIHGGADERVPVIHAERLREELTKRNHPFEWMLKEKEGHGFYQAENNIERWQRMLAFFDKYIGKTH